MYTEDSNSRQGVKSIPRETNKVLREFRRGRWCQTRREKLGGVSGKVLGGGSTVLPLNSSGIGH